MIDVVADVDTLGVCELRVVVLDCDTETLGLIDVVIDEDHVADVVVV